MQRGLISQQPLSPAMLSSLTSRQCQRKCTALIFLLKQGVRVNEIAHAYFIIHSHDSTLLLPSYVRICLCN